MKVPVSLCDLLSMRERESCTEWVEPMYLEEHDSSTYVRGVQTAVDVG